MVEQAATEKHSGAANGLSAIDARIDKLKEYSDVEFVRREARLIPVIINFWQHFNWLNAKSDPRSKAALSAMLWRVFSPGAAAAGAGGFLLLLQTWMLFQQNEKLDQQTYVMQAQANATVSTKVGEVVDAIWAYAESACLGPKLPKEIDPSVLIGNEEEMKCWVKVPSGFRRAWLQTCKVDKECTIHTNLNEFYPWVEPHDTQLPLPLKLQAQIVNLTNLARPYRFVESPEGYHAAIRGPYLSLGSELNLVRHPLSPERGQVFITLLRGGVDLDTSPLNSADFSGAYVMRARLLGGETLGSLNGVALPHAEMPSIQVRGAWVDSDFQCSKFRWANLRGVSIVGGYFTGSDFSGALLPDADEFKPADLSYANFDGAIVDSPEYLEIFSKNNVKGFNSHFWEIRREDGKFVVRQKDDAQIPHSPC
ncbi:MAG: pentapeptide repeat-containing protein [Moraxellaceae bacterium]|nr:pentapeptide repeat-containing protein [Moraxellaceae bacterium]